MATIETVVDTRRLGTRLRTLRHLRGLTLGDVAARTGLSVPFLSDMERGVSTPSLTTCAKLCALYSISLAALFADLDVAPQATAYRAAVEYEHLCGACALRRGEG